MWGNRTGWLISAGIAAVFGWALVMVVMPASMQAPTGAFSTGRQPAVLPIDPKTVFTPGADDMDAGKFYREAMYDYDQHRDQYTKWLGEDAAGAIAANPAGPQDIVKARNCARMDLFATMPQKLINYDDTEPLQAIYAVAKVTDNIANISGANGQTEKARQYGEALFALGYHLAQERVRWKEWEYGVTFMQWAAQDLAKVEPDRARAFADFNDKSLAFQKENTDPIYEKLSAIDPQNYAGDIYQLAQPDNPEAMWRVEAILRLGRLTYWNQGPGSFQARSNQLAARHFLSDLSAAKDPNLAIRTAADAAWHLANDPAEYARFTGMGNSN